MIKNISMIIVIFALLSALGCTSKRTPISEDDDGISIDQKIQQLDPGEKIVIVLPDDSDIGMIFSHSDGTNIFGNIYEDVVADYKYDYFWAAAVFESDNIERFPIGNIKKIIYSPRLNTDTGRPAGKKEGFLIFLCILSGGKGC